MTRTAGLAGVVMGLLALLLAGCSGPAAPAVLPLSPPAQTALELEVALPQAEFGVGDEIPLAFTVTMTTNLICRSPTLLNLTIYYYYCDAPDTVYTGESNGDGFGYSVAGLGNFNTGTNNDVIVGAPYHGTGGAVYIFNGTDSMPSSVSAANADYFYDSLDADSLFGWSVCKAGDLDGDSKQDVLIGAPGFASDGGSNADAGKTWVMSYLMVIACI